VDAAALSNGTGQFLDGRLQAAIAALAVGDTAAGVRSLTAFQQHVSGQSGKDIPDALAALWIAEAQQIIDAAG
jgi:hypothetical protein